jgi:hypothetical protein
MVQGHGTNAKKTFLPLLISGNMAGAAQRFLRRGAELLWGMGDYFAETRSVTFAGGNIGGRGQGFPVGLVPAAAGPLGSRDGFGAAAASRPRAA